MINWWIKWYISQVGVGGDYGYSPVPCYQANILHLAMFPLLFPKNRWSPSMEQKRNCKCWNLKQEKKYWKNSTGQTLSLERENFTSMNLPQNLFLIFRVLRKGHWPKMLIGFYIQRYCLSSTSISKFGFHLFLIYILHLHDTATCMLMVTTSSILHHMFHFLYCF